MEALAGNFWVFFLIQCNFVLSSIFLICGNVYSLSADVNSPSPREALASRSEGELTLINVCGQAIKFKG